MFKLFKKLVYACVIFLMVMPLVSCGGSGSGTVGGTTGTLGIGLTDATTDQYQAIYITIDEVQVKKQGEGEEEAGWLTVLTPEQTFNLLELVNGVIADLGLAELEAGEYGQMRLILGELPETLDTNIMGVEHPHANYLIKTGEGSIEELTEELKVPSGYQTGIKIVHGFTIAAGGATELILDFDACKSVVQAGKSGKWLLKPTIKVLDTINFSAIRGIVEDEEEKLLGGALVSAQIYTPPPEPLDGWDPKNEITNEGGTASDETGAYILYLPLNTYNIVATMAGYVPQCQVVAATDYLDYTDNNFTLTALTAENSGTFTGSVTGVATAEFSIRQAIDCGSGDVMIEVASVSVADGATSEEITLPIGTYEVVVSPEGEGTYVVEGDIEVIAGKNINVVYPPAP